MEPSGIYEPTREQILETRLATVLRTVDRLNKLVAAYDTMTAIMVPHVPDEVRRQVIAILVSRTWADQAFDVYPGAESRYLNPRPMLPPASED